MRRVSNEERVSGDGGMDRARTARNKEGGQGEERDWHLACCHTRPRCLCVAAVGKNNRQTTDASR